MSKPAESHTLQIAVTTAAVLLLLFAAVFFGAMSVYARAGYQIPGLSMIEVPAGHDSVAAKTSWKLVYTLWVPLPNSVKFPLYNTWAFLDPKGDRLFDGK